MRLSAALPIFAVAFAMACDTTTTAPNVAGLDALKPSFTAGSNETTCEGTLAAGTYQNIVVPVNANCSVSNSEVKHNITVLENSGLVVTGGTIVRGSILADKSRRVEITNTGVTDGNIVKGSIEITEFTETVFICGATLTHGDMYIARGFGLVVIGGTLCNEGVGDGNILEKGSLTVEDNVIASGFLIGLRINNNQVGKNLTVLRNLQGDFKTVAANTVGRTVQCFENDEPFIGGPNTASNAEGQCF